MRSTNAERLSAADETHTHPPNAPGPAAPPATFLRVSEAKRLYFGGKLSLRWWYRQIELGRLPHFRAGGAVLLRIPDVEAFVAAAYQDESPPPPASASDPPDDPPPAAARSPGGLRFFRK
jgi:hypothetical protein